jgi:cytochrome c-type biogenesis protein CcmE
MRQEQRISLGLAAACLVAVVALGCESNRELSPAAPSAITGGALQSEAAVSSSGLASAARPSVKPESTKVELKGTVAGLAGTCPAVSFSLGRVSIQANSATKYEDGDCEDLKNGAMVKVEGTKGSDGVVTAKEIEVAGDDAEDDEDDDAGDHHGANVELRGVISQLNGVCPAVTFKLDRVQVKTSDRTEFDEARCVDLKEGTAVKVKGVREGEGVLKASKVEAKKADDGEHHTVELRGTVADLKGTCPTMTFHMGRVVVTTNVKTKFEGIPCADLKDGNFVKVTGDPDPKAEKAVLATKVEAATHDSRPSQVTGTISSLMGSCPTATAPGTIKFKVGDTSVATNDRTRYRGLTCKDLANGKNVSVKGQLQADKTLLAQQVSVPKEKD